MARDSLTAGVYNFELHCSCLVSLYQWSIKLACAQVDTSSGRRSKSQYVPKLEACTSLGSLLVLVEWVWCKRVLEQVRFEGTENWCTSLGALWGCVVGPTSPWEGTQLYAAVTTWGHVISVEHPVHMQHISSPTAHWVQSTWHETADSDLVRDCIIGWNRAWWHTSNLHGGGRGWVWGYGCGKVHVVDASCTLLVHPVMPWSTEWAQWEDLFSV